MTTLDEFKRTTRILTGANQELDRPIIAKQDDVSGRTLRIQITDGGIVRDLSDATVFLCWAHESLKWKGIEPFIPVDATQGMFELAYPTAMQHPGTLKAYISICWNSRIINSINFNIYVQDDLGIEDALQDEDQFFASLKQELVDFQNTVDTAAEKFDAQLADQESRFDSQLQSQQTRFDEQATRFDSQLESQQTAFDAQIADQKSQFDTMTEQQHAQFNEWFDGLKEDVLGQVNEDLKTSLSELKGDVSTMKTDVTTVKGDVSTLKTDTETLETNVSDLTEKVEALESGGAVVEAIPDETIEALFN